MVCMCEIEKRHRQLHTLLKRWLQIMDNCDKLILVYPQEV